MMGISETFADVSASEVIRIYSDAEGTRMLYWLSSAYTVGFIIGIISYSISSPLRTCHEQVITMFGFIMAAARP